jgi:hypothetical protein
MHVACNWRLPLSLWFHVLSLNNSIHIDTYGHDNKLVLGYALRISPAKEVNTLLLDVVFGFTPINVGLEIFVINVTRVIMMGGFIETRREKY